MSSCSMATSLPCRGLGPTSPRSPPELYISGQVRPYFESEVLRRLIEKDGDDLEESPREIGEGTGQRQVIGTSCTTGLTVSGP